MQRPRWHDAVLVVGVLALLATGVWALWGKDIRAWFAPEKPAPVVVPPSGGTT
jgi:hypothetical protein